MAENNLLENKLFLQYLAAAGQDMLSGNAIGTNVNAVTQGNITAQNYAEFLRQMLGGKVKGGKLSADDKGIKIDISRDSPFFKDFDPMGEGGSMGGGVDMSSLATTSPGGTGQPASNIGGKPIQNPFAFDLPNFSPSDLAGLTPEMIQSGVTIGLKAREAAAKAGGVGITNTIKEYQFAQAQGFDGTLQDWKETSTTNWKDYQKAVEGGYEGPFNTWLTQIKRAGATRIGIGEKVKTAAELAGIEAEKYFNNPAKWGKDLDSYLESGEYLYGPGAENIDTPEKESEFKWDATVNWIEDKILAGNGEVTRYWENNRSIAVWKITWPNGREQEVRRAKR